MSQGREEQKISPRAMDVLVCLAENAPQVVSMDSLLSRFWTPHSSSDHAVHKILANLRRAFGDRPSDPCYIKTFPKRGYAIIAEVEFIEETATPAPIATPAVEPVEQVSSWSASLSLSAAVLAMLVVVFAFVGFGFKDSPSQAELPAGKIIALTHPQYVGLEEESSGQYLSVGLNTALVSSLSKLAGLSIMQLETDPDTTSLQAATELGASHLFKSSIFEFPDHHVLNLELIELSNGTTIFSDRYQFEPGNLLTTQSRVTDNVISSLSIYLDDEQRAAMHDWGTANALAYKNFIKAEFFKEQWNHSDWRMALCYYKKAIELDPGFVNAYTGLATAANYMAVYSSGETAMEMSATMLDYARRLELARPGHPSIETLKAVTLNTEGIRLNELASIYSSRIIKGNTPGYVFAQYGLYLQGARLYSEAEQFFALARADSAYRTSPNQQQSFSVASKPPWEAISDRKKELYERPHHIGLLGVLIQALALVGETDEAEFYFQRQASVDDEGIRTHLSKVYLSALSGELFALSQSGDHADSATTIADLRFPELFTEESLNHPDLQFNNAVMKLILGDIGSAATHFRSLNAVDQRRMVTRLHAAEVLFPQHVIASADYHELLDELGVGRAWQQQLMHEILEMQPVTGISLSSAAEAALQADRFLSRNTLWIDSQWDLLATFKESYLKLNFAGIDAENSTESSAALSDIVSF